MSQTITDENGRTYLVLQVAAAEDRAASPDERWTAYVCDPASPLAGAYAYGTSAADVREAVALVAWTAVMKGELVPFGWSADQLSGVQVALTTSTRFNAEWLAACFGNHASFG